MRFCFNVTGQSCGRKKPFENDLSNQKGRDFGITENLMLTIDIQ
jgi:hypothetical protein